MIVDFAPFRIDLGEERLWRGPTLLTVQRKPFAVLRYLVTNPHRLVTRQELTVAVWGDISVSESALRTHLHELRRVLREGVIETVVGRGYRFIAQFTTEVCTVAAVEGNPLPRSPLTTPARLVGRGQELSALQAAFQRASSGERQIVFVLGEQGIGKTALVETFLESARAQGAVSAHGQCVLQYGDGEAFLPILQALEGLCAGPAGQRVNELLHQRAPTWLKQLPWLVAEDQLELLERQVHGGTQTRMLRELPAVLEVLSVERPVILVLEDLQWTDRATVELIALLGQRRQHARIMVIATSRKADVLGATHPVNSVMRELVAHRHAAIVWLGSMDAPSVADYLTARFGEHAFPPGLAARLFRTTGGMPLFMVAFVDDLVATQMVRNQEERWRLGASLDEIAAHRPDNVMELINMQLDRLTHTEQRVLEAGGVAGVEFATGLVAAALEMAVEDVEERCDRLAQRENFLRRAGTEEWPDGSVQSRYAFVHTFCQHVCVARSIPARRQRWHRNIGERLERAYGPRAYEVAPQLAASYEHAQEYAWAAHYYATAAELAADQAANGDAINQFEKGLALLERTRASPQRDSLELRLLSGLAPLVQWSQAQGRRKADLTHAATRLASQQSAKSAKLRPSTGDDGRHSREDAFGAEPTMWRSHAAR